MCKIKRNTAKKGSGKREHHTLRRPGRGSRLCNCRTAHILISLFYMLFAGFRVVAFSGRAGLGHAARMHGGARRTFQCDVSVGVTEVSGERLDLCRHPGPSMVPLEIAVAKGEAVRVVAVALAVMRSGRRERARRGGDVVGP